VKQPEFIVANKIKFARDEALDLAKESETIWIAKGKKWIRFDLASDATDDEISKHILGPSGTLRAPAIRVGDTFMVGYHLEAYETLFGA
jgi:hypothetical protein